jgi:hypothetical protein
MAQPYLPQLLVRQTESLASVVSLPSPLVFVDYYLVFVFEVDFEE